jgi:hypothetical protein
MDFFNQLFNKQDNIEIALVACYTHVLLLLMKRTVRFIAPMPLTLEP